jgi:hypothetical protein
MRKARQRCGRIAPKAQAERASHIAGAYDAIFMLGS